MDEDGFALIHRRLMDHAIWSDDWLVRLFIWCILRASFRDRKIGTEVVKRGSFVTGKYVASEQLHVHPSKWYRGVRKLEEMGCVTVKTNPNNTLITVCNYETYQKKKSSGEPLANPVRTPGEPQANPEEQLNNSLVEREIANGLQNLIDGQLMPERLSDQDTIKAINEYCWFFYRGCGKHLDPIVLRERLKLVCGDWPAEKVRRSMATTISYNVTHTFFDPDIKPRRGKSTKGAPVSSPKQANPIT